MLVLTSGLDDRFGVGVVRSRIGLSRPAIPVFDDTNILEIYMEASREKEIACISSMRRNSEKSIMWRNW